MKAYSFVSKGLTCHSSLWNLFPISLIRILCKLQNIKETKKIICNSKLRKNSLLRNITEYLGLAGFVNTVMNLRVSYKGGEFSWLPQWLLSSQERFCSVKLAISFNEWIPKPHRYLNSQRTCLEYFGGLRPPPTENYFAFLVTFCFCRRKYIFTILP
jgi:hypothetical protein